MIKKLSQAKEELDQDHYQKGVYTLCDLDGKLSDARVLFQKQIGIIRRHLINTAAEAFDIHPEYPRYSLGSSEFSIQKVSLLQ